MIDLVCLVADRNMEAVVGTLLEKHQALGTRPIKPVIIQHPGHDPGCYKYPTGLLGVYRYQARHALVMFDRDWEGSPRVPTTEIEMNVEARMSEFPADWAKCIVIDPELEVWLFTRSPRLDDALGWHGRDPTLTAFLEECGDWPATTPKPPNPKVAMKRALSEVGKQTSSSIYREISRHLGLGRCIDPSFHRFRSTLQAWFPPQ